VNGGRGEHEDAQYKNYESITVREHVEHFLAEKLPHFGLQR
jgi:hypothetical protein